MGPHILVVGGTGMLSDMVEALAREGGRLSLLSRQASQAGRPGVTGYGADYMDDEAFAAALDRAIAASGPVDLAVAWFRTLKVAAPRRLAEAVGAPGRPGRLIQVLGSAVGDPDHPDRLARAAAVAEGLETCRLRQVVLGFRLTGQGARWNTQAEISAGVLAAIHEDLAWSVVGTLEPWSARPSSTGGGSRRTGPPAPRRW